MNYRNIIIAGLTVISSHLYAGDITVAVLTGNMQTGTTVTESLPRLGWKMTGAENGTSQGAYELEIYNSIDNKLIWKSGRIDSSESQHISIEKAFENIKTDKANEYSWRVRVWDENDNTSKWSEKSSFIIVPKINAANPNAVFSSGKWIGAITRH